MIHPIYRFILPLISAHLAGDFLFKPDDNAEKDSHPRVLIQRAAIVGLLSWMLLGTIQAWSVGLLVFILHAIVDYTTWKRSSDGLRAFLLNQLTHVFMIVVISYVIDSDDLLLFENYWAELWDKAFYAGNLLFSGAVLNVSVGGVVVGYKVRPFLDQLDKTGKDEGKEGIHADRNIQSRGFKEGGRTIGYLERALIYALVLVNQPAGIGFLIAAKSVFRFGEINVSSNRMEAEYILIGTLYSFLYGIVVSYIISNLLAHIGFVW